MRHFVREHVLERAEVARQWQHVALALCIRDTAGAFTEIAEDVVLREVGAAGEDHDRLALAEFVAQDARESRVRPFGHARGVFDRRFFFLVVVHAEVLSLEHPPLEPVVLHLVLPEVPLRAG